MAEQDPHPTSKVPEVEPNARYDAVFGTAYAGLDPNSEEFEEVRDETETERRARERVESAVEEETPARIRERDPSDEDYRELSWSDLSVTEDAQILSSVCTFFNGVHAGDDIAEIRRRLRTGEVEWYANAYLVVSGILDDETPRVDGHV